jgi:serine/threonine protein kinase
VNDSSATIDRVAMEIADFKAIDWPEVARSATGDELDSVAQLRVLAAIAGFHRAVHSSALETPPALEASTRDDAARVQFRWGNLQVHERLGAGAFGEVFRAWDTSLGREVALKLLRAGSTGGRSETIVREGRLLARVHHPNVMAVYGALETDGRIGIWGELLRGRTLAEIVRDDGPMSAQEAAVLVDSVCRALTAVHRAGLLHRDVKAQNVMRESGGRIVLMDFGLGLEADAALPANLAGTPAYLAPELLRGLAPSVQSDIYSVGVLLFYLVTGTLPVDGTAIADLARKHAAGERKYLQDLRSDLPAGFVRVVERALAPEPSARFESAGELQSALTAVGLGVPSAGESQNRGLYKYGLIATVALLLLALAAFFASQRKGEAPPLPIQMALVAPQDLTFTEGSRNVASISPDGRYVAFVGTNRQGNTQLWIRSLSGTTARPIADSEGASSPFWAPDSRSLAFFSNRGLQRVSVSGARSEILATLWENRGGSWSARGDGTLLFAPNPRSGLYRISPAGGAMQRVTEPDRARGEIAHLWPQFLPDGDHYIHFVLSNEERVRGLYVRSLTGMPARRLIATDASAIYASGRLLYVRDGTLYAMPFDAQAATTSGQPVAVIPDVDATWDYRSAISASQNGILIYSLRQLKDSRRLVWTDFSGRSLGIVADTDKFRNPAVSPDGRHLAVQWYRDSISELRIFDLRRGGWTRVPGAPDAQAPAWGPNGHLAFATSMAGGLDIYSTNVTTMSAPTLLVRSENDKLPSDWSPDGRMLAYMVLTPQGNYDIWLATLQPRTELKPLLASPAQEVCARFSPQGDRIAFASDASGRMEIYVRDLVGSAPPRRVSTQGGFDPVWRSDREVVYIDAGGTMMRVEVPDDPGVEIAPGQPVELFDTGIETPGTSRNHFALDRKAERVLLASPPQMRAQSGFFVLVGWPSLGGGS